MHQHQGLNHPSHPKQTEEPNEIQKQNTLLSPKTLNRHNLRDKIVMSLFHGSPKPESAPTAFKILPSSAKKNLLGDKNPKISLWVIPMKIMERNKNQKWKKKISWPYLGFFPQISPSFSSFPPPKNLHLLSFFSAVACLLPPWQAPKKYIYFFSAGSFSSKLSLTATSSSPLPIPWPPKAARFPGGQKSNDDSKIKMAKNSSARERVYNTSGLTLYKTTLNYRLIQFFFE